MFLNCYKLPNYSRDVVDASFAFPRTSELGYFTPTSFEPYVVIISSDNGQNNILEFRFDNQRHTTYKDKPTFSCINTKYDTPDWCSYINISKGGTVKTVNFDEGFKYASPKSCCKWFYFGDSILRITNIDNLDTTDATNMKSMFEGCLNLENIDVSKFNTKNVEDMQSMFSKCELVTDLATSSFITKNVKTMASMFNGCINLSTVNVDSFDTSSVTDFSSMFLNDELLFYVYCSNFDLSKANSISKMFSGCSQLRYIYCDND